MAALAAEHLVGEVDGTVAGGLGADQRTAEAESLAGKDAVRPVAQLLHHPGHEADFAATYADIARRNVGIGSDVAR